MVKVIVIGGVLFFALLKGTTWVVQQALDDTSNTSNPAAVQNLPPDMQRALTGNRGLTAVPTYAKPAAPQNEPAAPQSNGGGSRSGSSTGYNEPATNSGTGREPSPPDTGTSTGGGTGSTHTGGTNTGGTGSGSTGGTSHPDDPPPPPPPPPPDEYEDHEPEE
jgi:hypothetical protein